MYSLCMYARHVLLISEELLYVCLCLYVCIIYVCIYDRNNEDCAEVCDGSGRERLFGGCAAAWRSPR